MELGKVKCCILIGLIALTIPTFGLQALFLPDIQATTLEADHPTEDQTREISALVRQMGQPGMIPSPRLLEYYHSIGQQPPVVRDWASPMPSSPVTGTRNILVIMIDFPDHAGTQNQAYFNNLLFGNAQGQMRHYYAEVSYGQLTVQGQLAGTGWYRSAHNEDWWGDDTNPNVDVDDQNEQIWELAKEAVLAADNDFNFKAFDTDNDNVMDPEELSICIVHAGSAQDATGFEFDIWSHRWYIFGSGYSKGAVSLVDTYVDGVRISKHTDDNVGGYFMQAENSPMGTFAHEFGHDIGLPDLYDTDYSSDGVGDWCLMASGSWLGGGAARDGTSPAHPCAWSKSKLGWLTPIVVPRSMYNVSVQQAETSRVQSVYKLVIRGTEYFLTENREQASYDTFLPGSGILVWHIDDSQPNNDDEGHKKVDLEEAHGGVQNLDIYNDGPPRNKGDVNDPYRSSATGFYDGTDPNSREYTGDSTWLGVVNISVAGVTMTVDFMVASIAVTYPGWDDMATVLDGLGYSYTEIDPWLLTDYNQTKKYDVIFINCRFDCDDIAPSAATSLQQFVSQGGVIYASDWAASYIDASFPGYVSFLGYVGDGDQWVTGDVVDPGLATYLGANSIPLYFDLGSWVVINSVSANTTIYVSGNVPHWAPSDSISKVQDRTEIPSPEYQTWEYKPITVGFDYGLGRVIYTSFHHAAQGGGAAVLMEYLALSLTTQQLANQNDNMLTAQGYEVVYDERGRIDQGQSIDRTYSASTGENFRVILNWLPGAIMKLSVYKPGMILHGEVESASPPVWIEVGSAQSDYIYRATGVNVPYSDYEFAIAVGTLAVIPFGQTVTTLFTNTSYTLGFMATGNIYDDSGIGFIYAHRAPPKILFLKTDTSRMSATGQPTWLDYTHLVTVGGRNANPTTKYYEDLGLAPIKFEANATHYRFLEAGVVKYAVLKTNITQSNDYFVAEVITDGTHKIIILWGVDQYGTFASGVWFDGKWTDLASLTQGWYIIRWQDLNLNRIPDYPGEFTVAASG